MVFGLQCGTWEGSSRIGVAYRVDGAGGPYIFLALEQGRRSLSCKSADYPVDQYPVFVVEVLFAEGVGERSDGREFLRQSAGDFFGRGHRDSGGERKPIIRSSSHEAGQFDRPRIEIGRGPAPQPAVASADQAVCKIGSAVLPL